MTEAASLVHKKASLDEMWDVAAAVAHEFETGQGALVLAGLRTSPHTRVMRKVQVLEQICLFIEVVREVEPELRALVARRRGWTKPTGARG